MPRLRPALALTALALAVPFAACEDGQAPVSKAKTEGEYVTTGGLKYQVQVSRILNPYDVEDRDYFVGVDDAPDQVTRDEQWYGVFLRVENRTNKGDERPRTIQTAATFTISDTSGEKFKPTALPASNVFAYRSEPLLPGKVLPAPSSTAATASIGGSLVLFKVPNEVLDNRPTKLTIKPADGSKEATINLDI